MTATPMQREVANILSHFYPGVPTQLEESIADDLGVTRRSVETALTRFEQLGLIEWRRKTRGGHRRPWWDVTVLDPEQLCVLSESAGVEV